MGGLLGFLVDSHSRWRSFGLGLFLFFLEIIQHLTLAAARYGVCSCVTNKRGVPSKKWGRPRSFEAGPNCSLICQLLQIREIPRRGTSRRAWFPDIQERNVLTGHVVLVRIESLCEQRRMSLEFSPALGFCKREPAWTRVLVLSSNPVRKG